MNNSLNMTSKFLRTTENDFCIVDLLNETITWKSGMFNPKMRNDILYWFKERKN